MSNTSAAVMQKRSEPTDSLDDFPTPPWATRALCRFLAAEGFVLANLTCREPSANRGVMVKTLEEEFAEVSGADIFDYGYGFPVKDYLKGSDPPPTTFTITNPPYTLAEAFVQRMLRTSTMGCAVILRSAFAESKGRYERLFSVNPPTFILQFVERVGMAKGKVDPNALSAMAYAWFVWIKGEPMQTEFKWIPPCRKKLERPEDYE